MTPRKLNLGCGHTVDPYFFSGWLNVDHNPAIAAKEIPGAVVHDIRQPLPLPEASLDVVFSEHVLEHFDMRAAAMIAAEVHRVLAFGGVLRIAVPDAILRRDHPPESFPDEHGHLTAWTHDSLRWLLVGAGFSPRPVRYWTSGGQLIESDRAALAGLGRLRRPASLIFDGLREAA